MVELATDMAYEKPDYKRGVQIILYSTTDGPIPAQAVSQLEREARKVAEAFGPALAITIVEE
jgi:hypothetical protein